MVFELKVFRSAGKKTQREIPDYRMEMLVKQGRDQFKKLVSRGMNVPVALL